jgi:hypothetical protein
MNDATDAGMPAVHMINSGHPDAMTTRYPTGAAAAYAAELMKAPDPSVMHRDGVMLHNLVVAANEATARAEKAEAALQRVTARAEAALRQVAELCDKHERAASSWENPLPAREWIPLVRAAMAAPVTPEETT